jgi:hypothetical protein
VTKSNCFCKKKRRLLQKGIVLLKKHIKPPGGCPIFLKNAILCFKNCKNPRKSSFFTEYLLKNAKMPEKMNKNSQGMYKNKKRMNFSKKI